MNAFILMTRIPIPGKTKTRLMSKFSGEECANLHRYFLKDIFRVLNRVEDLADIFVAYTPENSIEKIDDIIPQNAGCFNQEGDTLGLRMLNAFKHIFNLGYDKVILMGSDIPLVQPGDITNAFNMLDENDIVIGPTFDGGYYLIGMKKCYGMVFDDKLKWGNKSVFEGTISIANRYGLKVGLAAKNRDIDTGEDIDLFEMDVSFKKDKEWVYPENTINYLKKIRRGTDNVKGYIR